MRKFGSHPSLPLPFVDCLAVRSRGNSRHDKTGWREGVMTSLCFDVKICKFINVTPLHVLLCL